jgi:hypothetical protein
MSPRYRKAIIATLTASGVSLEAAEGQANQILSTLQGGKPMFTPKEKATVAAVAHGAFQRSHIYQDTSTKILFMQGQIIENRRKSLFLMISLGKTGAANMKGSERY